MLDFIERVNSRAQIYRLDFTEQSMGVPCVSEQTD